QRHHENSSPQPGFPSGSRRDGTVSDGSRRRPAGTGSRSHVYSLESRLRRSVAEVLQSRTVERRHDYSDSVAGPRKDGRLEACLELRLVPGCPCPPLCAASPIRRVCCPDNPPAHLVPWRVAAAHSGPQICVLGNGPESGSSHCGRFAGEGLAHGTPPHTRLYV